MNYLIAFFITTLALNALADNKSCLAEVPEFKTELKGLLSDSADLSNLSFAGTCTELAKQEAYAPIKASDLRTVTSFDSYAYIIEGQSKELRDAYREKLRTIAALTDRNTRILKAYELATKAFAEFDLQKFKEQSAKAKLIDYAAQKAALLAYSLDQVRKIKSEYSVSHLTSFESDQEKRRSLVRVELSKIGGPAGTFDFDPHASGVRPSPLVPLYKKIAEHDRKVLEVQCERLQACLQEQRLGKQ